MFNVIRTTVARRRRTDDGDDRSAAGHDGSTPPTAATGPTLADAAPPAAGTDLVPLSILGPAGQAGIPTIPAVTMPLVEWTQPARAGNAVVWRFRSDGSRLDRSAREAAGGPHHGDPLEEPGLAHLVAGLRRTLTQVFRSDSELLGVQHLVRTWDAAVDDAALAVVRANQVHAAALVAARDIDPATTDPVEQRSYTAGAHAADAVRAAEAEHAAALQAQRRAQELALVAGQRAMERLDLVSLAGVERIDRYRAAYAREQVAVGRPGLGPLPDDLAEQLVAEAVRRATGGEPEAGPDDDQQPPAAAPGAPVDGPVAPAATVPAPA